MCNTVNLPGGGYAIVCGGHNRKVRKCACGKVAALLCDWPIGGGKTCDKPVCQDCAVKGGPNVDFCPSHERLKL